MKLVAPIVLLAIAATAARSAPAAEPPVQVKRARLVLTMPRPRHTAVTRRVIRIADHPAGVYVFMQLKHSDGSYSPQTPVGRRVVLASAGGKRQATVTLSSAAYFRARGRISFAVKVRNLRIPRRQIKRSRVTVVVSVTYR